MADEIIDGLMAMAASPLYRLRADLLLRAAAEIRTVREQRDTAKGECARMQQAAVTADTEDAARWRQHMAQLASGQIDDAVLVALEATGKSAAAPAAGALAAAIDDQIARGRAAEVSNGRWNRS